MAAAVLQALDLPELAEQILLKLSDEDLLKAYQINTRIGDIINDTPSLQRRLFFQLPLHLPGSDDDVGFNPFFLRRSDTHQPPFLRSTHIQTTFRFHMALDGALTNPSPRSKRNERLGFDYAADLSNRTAMLVISVNTSARRALVASAYKMFLVQADLNTVIKVHNGNPNHTSREAPQWLQMWIPIKQAKLGQMVEVSRVIATALEKHPAALQFTPTRDNSSGLPDEFSAWDDSADGVEKWLVSHSDERKWWDDLEDEQRDLLRGAVWVMWRDTKGEKRVGYLPTLLMQEDLGCANKTRA